MNFLSYFLNPSNLLFPPSRRYRLEVSASENEILKVQDFAQAICTAAGYSQADSNVVKLVLEEICVNIVRHAYKGDHLGKIQLEMSIGYFGLRISVTDQGSDFDFKSVKDPDLNHYVEIAKKGGLGLWFVRKMMTRVRYHSYPDHNEWSLYYRPTKSDSKSSAFDKKFDGVSIEFILASFVLFTFLMFLVYALSSLVLVPSVNLDESMVRRIEVGFSTTLCKGILLVYGMGLVGFFLIFQKLFRPFREAQSRQRRFESAWKHPSAPKDQGEYERLVSVISEMEEKLKLSQMTIDAQAKTQLELQSSEKEQRERADATEKILKEETAAIAKLRRDEKDVVDNAKEEMGSFSKIKADLAEQLKQAQEKLRNQEHIQEGMRKEVKVAQQIQHALLPKEFPQIEGFQIGASYRAASEVGGDYYDFIWVDSTTLGIAVGDVAGKGVPGSMVMAMIRTAMRLEARKNKSPSNVLLKVHQHVNGDMKRGMFATMFYIILDSRQRSIRFASAGHNPMILYRRSTDEVYFLKPKGFPLGIDLPDESLFAKTLAVQKLSLQKEDVLLIYTDGVTEAMNGKNEQFGESRLIKTIRENSYLAADELVQKIEASIAEFVGDAEQSDDVTIVAIKENLQAEDVIYKFRKNLLSLVDKEGLSIAEACRRMNVSAQTYYYYKEIYDKKGMAGLKPVFPKKHTVVKELSITQIKAVMSVVKSNPELGPAKIVEFLKRSGPLSLRLDTKVVAEFLARKGLAEARERKVFAANEIDTV